MRGILMEKEWKRHF